MNYAIQTTVGRAMGGATKLGLSVASGLLLLAVAAGTAVAQTAPAPAPKAPAAATTPAAPAAAKKATPAAGAPATAAAPVVDDGSWIKLCDKIQVPVPDKDGKVTAQEKNICITHTEQLDASSGMTIVATAFRQVEGSDKQSLIVTVPLVVGIALPPGLRAIVFTKENWEKGLKQEKIDEATLKTIELKYILCAPAGCTAEIDITKDVLANLKTGGGILVMALNGAAQAIRIPVSLKGFATALDGKPGDGEAFNKQRQGFYQDVRARQEEALKQWMATQQSQDRLAPKPGELAPAPQQPKKP
jgi:invasion protein IalB